MFRRKRASSHAPVNSNPSPSAQTAAVQAFRASQGSNAQLSSAAAAAALRKHPTPPTSVEDVQTKRMVQRRLSGSSAGSAPGPARSGGQDGGLRRSRSSGSMTTRSFRGSSPLGTDVLTRSDKIDPVPPIPQAYAHSASAAPRAASLRSPFRSVPPPHKRTGARGSSMDGGPGIQKIGSPETTRINDSIDLERNGSRNSINFSYPTKARPNSPQQGSSFEAHRMDGKSPPGSNQISPTPVSPTRQDLHIGREQRIPKLRQTDTPQSEGSHHSASERSVGSHDLQRLEYEDVRQRDQVTNGAHGGKATDSESSDHVPTSLKKVARVSTDPSNLGSPKRVPSTVREDREDEDQDRKHEKLPQNIYEDNADMSQPAGAGKDISTVPARPQDGMTTKLEEEDAQKATTTSTASLREERSSPPVPEPHQQQEPNTLLSAGDTHASNRTAQSPSPNRATRFSDSIVVTTGENHLHEPPPKSTSAGKSALKRSTSQSRSPGPRSADPNETTEDVSSGKAPTTDQKRKTAKVSFGAEAERHAHSASPMSSTSSPPSSPQSVSRGPPPDVGRKHGKESIDMDGFDDVLKPRPTLPSFGSIRGRRPFVEDRPTEHSERDHHPTVDIHSSNDHAIGGLAAEAVSNGTSHGNRQEESNLPLPPQVTSVEGSGYEYSSDYSSDSDEVADWTDIQPPRAGMYSPPPRSRSEQRKDEPRDQPHERQQHLDTVPTISVQPSTPRFEEPSGDTKSDPIPGSFPQQDEESSDFAEQKQNIGSAGVMSAPADEQDDSSDSDSSESVYSDAAEDLSDLDGDGFGSINAIVDSPVSKVPQFTPASPPGSPTSPRTETRKNDTSSQPAAPSSLRSSSPDYRSTSPIVETEPPQRAENETRGHTIEHVPVTSSQVSQEPSPLGSIQASGQEPIKGTYPIGPQNEPTEKARQQSRNVEQYSSVSRQPQTQQRAAVFHGSPKQKAEYSGYSRAGAAPKERDPDSPGRNHLRDVQAASRGLMQRTLSNGSDSSSSFKRERRSPPRTGRYTLRRTLRDGTQGRSLSADNSMASGYQGQQTPPEGGRSTLRTTLRGPPNGTQGKSSLLSGSSSPKSKGFPGRKLFQGSSQKHDAKEQKPFRSRFEDSSDDEVEMSNLRPVRGIPRRRGEVDGDSTELEDSSDNAVDRKGFRKQRSNHNTRPSAAARTTPAAAAAAAGLADANKAAPAPGDSAADIENYLRERNQRKPGLLNRLSRSTRKGRNEEARIRKLELESAARRDTPLERSRYELRETKGSTPAPAVTTTTVSAKNSKSSSSKLRPKLQKRKPGQAGSGPWPVQSSTPEGGGGDATGIPPSVPEDNTHPSFQAEEGETEARRPHTSDGVTTNGKHKSDNNDDNTGPNHNNAGGGGGGPSLRTKRILPRLRFHRREEKGDGVLNEKVPRSPVSDGGGTASAGADAGGQTGSVVFKGGGEKRNRFPLLRKALGLKK